jgi:predicted Fe-Mo cluster-binding NifX family protein
MALTRLERINMKIAVSSTGQDLDAAVDPRFGRCAYFAILDTDSGVLEVTPNPFPDAAGGAGTQAAQWILDRDAAVLLTGHCGPKAAAVLADAGIRVVEGVSGSVREVTEPFRGNLGGPPGQRGTGLGPGRGTGTCRRAGGGRGIGAARGNGPGRGLGRGRGAGGGQG